MLNIITILIFNFFKINFNFLTCYSHIFFKVPLRMDTFEQIISCEECISDVKNTYPHESISAPPNKKRNKKGLPNP